MLFRFHNGFTTCACYIVVCAIFCITTNADAQQVDIARLVHPEVAERLSLSDQQRAQIQQLVLERANALAGAADGDAKAVVKTAFEARALELLSPDQVTKLSQDQPSQKLSFQFRDMKWEQVLAWFADQQDLTLVMDRIPPGSFTYSDTRTYSPAEAIDLLNSVLMTRGFSLVRREKMLTVMELNDALPVELLPRVTLDQLPQRGRFELVSVVFPLGGRPIDAVLGEIKPYLNSYGRVLPLAQGSQVLVIENAGKMQTINELIASVAIPKKASATPPPPAPEPVLASYPIGVLDSTATLAFIRKLIPSENITIDDKAGILSAFVIPAQQTAIQSALATMQEKHAELPGLQSVAYKLSGVTPADFKSHVISVVPLAKVLTTADQGLVMASPQEQEKIKGSLAALKILPVQADLEMRVFEVAEVGVGLVETGLKKFLPDSQITSNESAGTIILRGSPNDLRTAEEIIQIWKRTAQKKQVQIRTFPLDRKATADWLATVLKIVPNAKLWLGDNNKQLLMLAEPAEFIALDSVLPQLQTLLPESLDRKLQIYKLSKQQRLRRTTLSALPIGLSEITVTETAGGAELLVWATENQHEQFAEFLRLLDEPAALPTQLVPQSYALKVQDTPTVLSLLTADFPDAKFSLNEDATQLTALADPALHEKIQTRVEQFNQVLPSRAEKMLRTYQSTGMTPAQLQLSLTGVLAKATVQIDAERSRLLVWATEQQHADISKIVELLNEKPTVDMQKIVVVYPLESATATAVKTLLSQLDSEVTIVADDKLKQLAVTGTIAKQATIQSAIKQIDRPAGSAATPEVRGYDLKSYQAAQILPTLQSLWPDMKMSADTVSNKIIASGTTQQLDQFSGAIEKMLSAPAGKQPVVRTYPVPVGDMTTLPAILTQIAPQATVSSDIVSRTVTVLATEELQARVKEALEQISSTAQSAKRPASYQLKPTQLAAAQTALQSLFPGVSSAVDATTGQIVVVANEQMQTQIAAVIELLASGPNAAERSVQVFQLNPEKIDLTNFLTTLQSLIPSQVKVELNAQTGALVAIGAEQELREVSKQVEMLKDRLPAPLTKFSKVYKLQHAAPASALAILQTLVPKVTLVQDLASRSIAGTGSEQDHAKIVEFLAAFDLPVEPKTYVVKPTQLTSALTSLRSLFPTVEMSSDATTGQIVVLASSSVQQQVEKIVELLVNGPNAAEKTVRVFPISRKFLESPTFLTTLKSLIPIQVSLESNLATESVIAIGTSEELQKVEQQIAQLSEQLPIPEEMKSAVYRLKHAAPLTIATVVQPLVPRAIIAQDAATATLAVSARAADQQKIEELVKLLDMPKQMNVVTRSYRVKRGSGRGLATVLSQVMIDAKLFGDVESGALLATATEEQHQKIQEIVQEYEGHDSDRETRVFSLDKADAKSLQTAIAEWTTEAKVASDKVSNSLIVTAPSEVMTRIESMVKEVDGDKAASQMTAFYPVNTTDPTAMARSLQVNYPKALIAGDAIGGGVFVTATLDQHAQIRELIDEVNLMPSKLPTLKSFTIKHIAAASVARGLTDAFGRRSDAGVTISEPTNAVFVVGSRETLLIAEKIIEHLDTPSNNRQSRQLRVFPVEGMDSEVAVSAIEAAFREDPRKVDVRYDRSTSRIYIFADPEQVVQVEQVLASLKPEPRELQVVQLAGLDPYVAKEATDALFFDTPYSLSPVITVDNDRQQLLIKASAEQLKQVRSLLEQMGNKVGEKSGEPQGRPGQPGSSQIRFVPVTRNSQRVLDELQKVWPTLRGNPLRVLYPAEDAKKCIQGDGTHVSSDRTQFVSQNTPPVGPSPSVAIPSVATDPPVVIVLSENQWTLASEDVQALDELERVLELIRSSRAAPFLTSGNYSVYLLQRASASEVQLTLEQLLRSDRTGEGRRTTSMSDLARRVKIVADTRTNALIVSGSQNDRQLIEELLGVLDSDELIGALQQLLPTSILLQSANATQVETILKVIYRAQLATSASRKPIQIPEGVSAEVTTLLQQLNAESASPLLTMTADEVTNSIIVRAPQELAEEIRQFVRSLDSQTASTPSRRVDLIQLKSTNTQSIEAALKRLMAK